MSTLPGAAVWAALAALLVAWLALTTADHRLPTIADVVHFFQESWAGRLVLLGLWGEVGFHVLTQHP